MPCVGPGIEPCYPLILGAIRFVDPVGRFKSILNYVGVSLLRVLLWSTVLLLVASQISSAEEIYRCSIQRVCSNTATCRIVSDDPTSFTIEPDGSAFLLSGHKSSQYQLVSVAKGSRTFFSDDHGNFPSLRTIYDEGNFIESVHVARPKDARPDEVGPFQFSGICERIGG